MKLTYIHHSGYLLQEGDTALLIDYWKDTETDSAGLVHQQFLQSGGQRYVLASHVHPDHFNPEILQWKQQQPDLQLVLSRDILKRRRAPEEAATYLRRTEVYQDDRVRIEAFGSTDVGVSFAIEAFGLKIFHAGDFNNWHWSEESTPSEARGAEHDYLEKLKVLADAYPAFDLVMFPLDPRLGSAFTRGAEQFISAIHTKTFAPMHFALEPGKEKIVNQFAPVAESKGVRYLSIWHNGDSFEL